MFKLLPILILLLGCTVLSQQPVDPPKDVKTKLEAFQARTGVVIIRGFTEIGTISGLYDTSAVVESKEFIDAGSGRKEYGITIQVKSAGRSERENTSFVDYDEIESLIKGLDYISKVEPTVTQLSNFQADYRTKDDLECSTFSSSRGEILFAIKSGRIGTVTSYFKAASITEFRKLLLDAKAKIDSIRGVTKTNDK